MAFNSVLESNQNVYEAYKLLFERLKETEPEFETSVYLEKFQKLPTNSKKVDFVYAALKQHNLLPKFLEDKKRDLHSIKERETGDIFYFLEDFAIANRCYTASVRSAKSNRVKSLAYANRSASLLKLNLYQECLTDIERALTHNYPQNLRYKLLRRRQEAEDMMDGVSPEPFHQDLPKIPISRRNPFIQSAKDCVEITKDDSGCHIVATRDIQIGEVIAVEKPYVCTLTPEDSVIHCYNCLKLCYNLLPCDNCASVMFCSEECKREARNSYHKHECCILLSVASCGMECLTWLSVRTVLSAKKYLENLDELRLTEGEVYRSDRYNEIHNLQTNADKKPPEKLFRKAINAAFIFHLLENYSFFFSGSKDNVKESFKSEILSQLLVTQIYPLTASEVPVKKSTSSGHFGFGIYPFSSLVNHSCVNNIDFFNYGTTAVMRAVNTIKKGEECVFCHTPPYDKVPREVRREMILDRFYFNCECKACRNNWPMEPQPSTRLFQDLDLTLMEFVSMMKKLDQRCVNAAKKYLPLLVPKLRKLEKTEPFGNGREMKDIVVLCYRLLANRKPF